MVQPSFLYVDLENELNKKETERMRVKYASLTVFCYSPISCLQIKFQPRLLVNVGDPALTLTGTLIYVQTGGGSKIWPWLHQPHLCTRRFTVRAAPFCASGEATDP